MPAASPCRTSCFSCDASFASVWVPIPLKVVRLKLRRLPVGAPHVPVVQDSVLPTCVVPVTAGATVLTGPANATVTLLVTTSEDRDVSETAAVWRTGGSLKK